MTKVGIYNLGVRAIEVFYDPKLRGASFECGDKALSRIIVGSRRGLWEFTVSDLLHEIMEMCLLDMNARFAPCMDYAEASDGYVFHFNHDQFSQIVARAGHLFAEMLPDLRKAFDKHGKASRRKLH